MEDVPLVNQDTTELPQLFQSVVTKGIDGFDSVEEIGCVDRCTSSTYSSAAAKVIKSTPLQDEDDASQTTTLHQVHAISISMPLPRLGPRRVLFNDEVEPVDCKEKASTHAISFEMPKRTKSYQPKSYVDTAVNGKYLEPMQLQMKNPRSQRLKNNQFASFKTFSGTFERQRSHFLGKQRDVEAEADASVNTGVEPLPVGRYFDALEGPELDTLRGSEELVLPEDRKWPFLLRYPITSFGICLGTSSQSILWKTIATSKSTRFLHVNVDVNLILWCISVAIASMVFFTYSLKVIFYFEAVRREYYHPIRINFFFAPWIALLFLALGIPPSVVKDLPPYLWYILMTPILCLELKLYGQWMSGGSRRLSKVANPTNHLAVVGNFVGALLGASMGLKEGPIFFFAVGMAHYTVLFVTLYQRLPTNETLPKELHPVFFLFVAAPSVASMAWARIQGKFDYGSRIPYFIAMFLYCSLAVRVNFFRGFKFSLSWWAYTFPMTGAAIATIRYSNEVKNPITQALAVLLSAISTLAVTSLLISTMIHAFVMCDLFPNDIAIAIAHTNVKDTVPVHQNSAPSAAKTTDQSVEATNSVEQ